MRMPTDVTHSARTWANNSLQVLLFTSKGILVHWTMESNEVEPSAGASEEASATGGEGASATGSETYSSPTGDKDGELKTLANS